MLDGRGVREGGRRSEMEIETEKVGANFKGQKYSTIRFVGQLQLLFLLSTPILASCADVLVGFLPVPHFYICTMYVCMRVRLFICFYFLFVFMHACV